MELFSSLRPYSLFCYKSGSSAVICVLPTFVQLNMSSGLLFWSLSLTRSSVKGKKCSWRRNLTSENWTYWERRQKKWKLQRGFPENVFTLPNLVVNYHEGWPGRVAQSVGHLTRKSVVLGSIPGLATYFRFSFRFFKKGSCQLLAKVCARSTG